ncbi:flagellar motor switch protein FliM [Parasphingorhabdus cellanae]|uniref:Flagellar motor switch protein FliM n=1 Tax=Parasphingorhabdus cellanae TaxID=2806553 RepID=A0ABX7T8D6_9SPHN|nr:FliM/FliN family flagellar motor switch protein [Parasphingorhabdus cellanae]QTD56475.1 FliM/FliN family flagellar motor switch protein [Parasphingorhabdus cellanae]
MTIVATHRFAEKSNHSQTDLSPLKRVSDRYARGLSDAVERIAAIKADVDVQDVRFQSFGEWVGGLESLSSLSVFRLLPLRGSLILRLEETMISTLVELYFGGKLGPIIARKKDSFRDAELQLIERLGQALVEQLADCFTDYTVVKPAMMNHESNALHVTICKKDEEVMCQSFSLSLGPDSSWDVDLIYSADAAEGALELIQNKSMEQSDATDPDWQREWHRGLQHIHMPLRTILAQPVMRLPELFQMKPGDIIPITPRVKPPLFIANHKFATGTLGEKNGCAAFKIEHIERGDAR